MYLFTISGQTQFWCRAGCKQPLRVVLADRVYAGWLCWNDSLTIKKKLKVLPLKV